MVKGFKKACGVLLVGVVLVTMSAGAGKRVYKDCEDTGKTPCVTFDDGHWRKVTSYDPYKSKVVKVRKVKKGYVIR